MQQSAAEPLRQQKKIWLINMQQSNPEFYADYIDGGGERTKKAIMTIEKAVSDPVFKERMIAQGQESTLKAMMDYVYYRRNVVAAVEQTGKSITDPDNAWIAESWAQIRQDLKTSSVRWAEIATRWLDTDDNPQFPGDWAPDLMTEVEQMGVSGG